MEKSWAADAMQLLSFLSSDDIFQLATTVCKGVQLKITSRNEAVKAIIAASDSPDELLRKKKMKREYLLRYVWEYGQPSGSSSFPVKADKQQLIREVLSLWGYANSSVNASGPTVVEAEDDDDEEEDTGAQSSQESTPAIILEFAQKFLDWFYNLLNNIQNGDDFGAQHFYGNCLLRLRCGTAKGQSAEVEVDGSMNVAQRFQQFVLSQRLIFQPNLRLPNGFQAVQESHGAVLLKCNGTVHRRPPDTTGQLAVLGPYEQTFLVMEDPESKTWKIQQTLLMINAEISLSTLSIGTA